MARFGPFFGRFPLENPILEVQNRDFFAPAAGFPPLINPHFRTSKSPKFSACGGLSLAKETLNGPKSAAGEKKIGISRVYTGGNASKTAPIRPPPPRPPGGPGPGFGPNLGLQKSGSGKQGGGFLGRGGGFSAIYLLMYKFNLNFIS